MIYLLWAITVTDPLGAEEVLRFTNVNYAPTTGADAFELHRATLTRNYLQSAKAKQVGYARDASTSVMLTGGMLPKETDPIVVDNRLQADGTYELAYLFAGGYELTGDILGYYAITETVPEPADWNLFFFGSSIKSAERTDKTVVFYPGPNATRARRPLLTKDYSGMAGYWDPAGGNPFETDSGDAPDIFADDWTIMIHLSTVDAASGNRNILEVLDGSGDPLVRIYRDHTAEEVKLSITETWPGTIDTYSLFSTAGPGADPDMGDEDFFWIAISWSDTGGTFNVYTLGVRDALGLFDHPVVDEAILSPGEPSGTADTIRMDQGSIRYSALRVWSRPLTAEEVLARFSVLDPTYEDDLEAAYEFDLSFGDSIADHSGNARHVSLGSLTGWGAFTHGDPALARRPQPLALGTCHGIPIRMALARFLYGAVSVSTSYVEHVYSRGVPLIGDLAGGGTESYSFNHTARTIDRVSADEFGGRFSIGQRVRVFNSGTGTWEVQDEIESITPNPLRALRLRGTDHRFTVTLEAPGWASSGIDTAAVAGITSHADWSERFTPNPYDPDAVTNEFQWVSFLGATPEPITADVVGDPEILATTTIAPGEHVPPGTVENVTLQALTRYGTADVLQTSDFVVPGYDDFDSRVGVYVADRQDAYDVVDRLLAGHLVWLDDAGGGAGLQFAFRSFSFPEDIAPGNVEELTADLVLDYDEMRVSTQTESGLLKAIDVYYHRNWTPMNDVAAATDPETRDFMTQEWRTLVVGDDAAAENERGIFKTLEIRPNRARALGDMVLRLSQGVLSKVTVAVPESELYTRFPVGYGLDGELPRYGVAAFSGVILRREQWLAEPKIDVYFWRDR